ncbi:MAG: BREX-4 system phosphatase PglZ [Candidatus Methanomethylicaceae archaeon]
MIFDNIEELIKYMEKDKNSKEIYNMRFPVRFILLSNYELLHKLIDNISHNINVISIADALLTENDEGWLTISHISNFFKKLDLVKDYMILGISEILRFYGREELFALLNSIIEIERNPDRNIRIYIPLVGLKNRVENEFFSRYTRRFEWDPLWIVNGNVQKIKIYFVSFDVKDAFIKNSKNFLNLWKESKLPNKIVSCSKTLYWQSSYFIPDEIYSFEKISNIKDYINKCLYIDIPVEFDNKENKLWEELLSFVIRNKKSFKDLAESILNIKNFNLRDTLDLWSRGNEFSRWILKWYVLSNENLSNTYLFQVLKDLKSYGEYDLVKEYFLKIFDFDMKSLNQNFLKERRENLRYFYENNFKEIPKFVDDLLIKKIKNLSEEEIPKYLVGISSWEKEWIISNFDNIKNIPEIYPELYYYLEELFVENLDEDKKWVIEYFREYRLSKLRNKATDNLISLLEAKNNNKDSFYSWYYSFDKVKNIYYKEVSGKKIFIDALGLEFINLFLYFLRKYGFKIYFYVGVSELPSITEYNKLPADEYIDELDKFIHDQSSYSYPRTFVEEIEVIKKIAKYVSTLGDELLIFSDHGFTIFTHYQLEGIKRYNFENAHHDGRCMEITNDVDLIEGEDFFIHIFEDKENIRRKYVISLKYVSLKSLSRKEVHGGATPEEVLVPIIYATKKVLQEEKYEIIILESKISIRNPILHVKINPKPKEDVIVKYLNNVKSMEYDEESKIYKLVLKDIKIGKLRIKIKIKDYEEDFIVDIVGGVKERDLL